MSSRIEEPLDWLVEKNLLTPEDRRETLSSAKTNEVRSYAADSENVAYFSICGEPVFKVQGPLKPAEEYAENYPEISIFDKISRYSGEAVHDRGHNISTAEEYFLIAEIANPETSNFKERDILTAENNTITSSARFDPGKLPDWSQKTEPGYSCVEALIYHDENGLAVQSLSEQDLTLSIKPPEN